MVACSLLLVKGLGLFSFDVHDQYSSASTEVLHALQQLAGALKCNAMQYSPLQ